MKIVKKKLDDMYRCYCASNIYFDNQNHILLASEDPDVACNMYYGKDYETKENVWTHPGGCMSIVPIPGKEKEFFTAFQSRVPSKAFWDDCKKIRNNINEKSMAE